MDSRDGKSPQPSFGNETSIHLDFDPEDGDLAQAIEMSKQQPAQDQRPMQSNEPYLEKKAEGSHQDDLMITEILKQTKPLSDIRSFVIMVLNKIKDFIIEAPEYVNELGIYCKIQILNFEQSFLVSAMREEFKKNPLALSYIMALEKGLVDLVSKLLHFSNTKNLTIDQATELMKEKQTLFLALSTEIYDRHKTIQRKIFAQYQRTQDGLTAPARQAVKEPERLVNKAVYDAHLIFFTTANLESKEELTESAFLYAQQFNQQHSSVMIPLSAAQIKRDLQKMASSLEGSKLEHVAYSIHESLKLALAPDGQKLDGQRFMDFIFKMGNSLKEEKPVKPNKTLTKPSNPNPKHTSAAPRIPAEKVLTPEEQALLIAVLGDINFSTLLNETKLPPCTGRYPGYQQHNMYANSATGTVSSSRTSPTVSSAAAATRPNAAAGQDKSEDAGATAAPQPKPKGAL